MFALGLVSFFQMVFIPGFILVKYMGIIPEAGSGRGQKIRLLVYAFGLSLLINYVLVFSFTVLGIYKPLTIYILLVVEGILLWLLIKKSPSRGLYWRANIEKAVTSVRGFFTSHTSSYNILFILSCAVILLYAVIFFNFFGTAFVRWDPVTNWNRFALAWANNQFPVHTWHYPQLITANWSLTYVIMQHTEVQLFAKAIMPLFSLGILLLFLDLGLRKKNAAYFLSAVICGLLLFFTYGAKFLASGHMDIPVSFFAFLSFHVMHGHQREDKTRDFKTIWLAVILASAAAVTKQAGLYILVFVLVWGLGSLYKSRKTLSRQRTAVKILLLVLTIIILTGSWYTIKEFQIRHDEDIPEFPMLKKAHQERSYTGRFSFGVSLLFRDIHFPFLVYTTILLVLLSLFNKKSWFVSLFIVIPYTVIWGFLYSYDTRNLAFVLPFMAFSAGFGTESLIKLLPGPATKPLYKIPTMPVIIMVLLVVTAATLTIYKKEALIRQQNLQRLKMSEVRLNEMLYKYHEQVGLKGKIATRYRELRYLPVINKYYRRINWCCKFQITLKFFKFLHTKKGKDIRYFLLHEAQLSDKGVFNFYWNRIKDGKYRLIFKVNGYLFVQVRK